MLRSAYPITLSDTYIFAAIFIGIVVSLFWYERELLSPGGVVVPGFVAIFLLLDPIVVAYTVLVALLTSILIKQASRITILFGRRRFTVTMLASMTLTAIIQYVFTVTNALQTATQALPILSGVVPVSGTYAGFGVIGIIIPGLIANEMHRQGPIPTLSTLSIVSTITALITIGVSGFL